jgi:hypothetical protein
LELPEERLADLLLLLPEDLLLLTRELVLLPEDLLLLTRELVLLPE